MSTSPLSDNISLHCGSNHVRCPNSLVCLHSWSLIYSFCENLSRRLGWTTNFVRFLPTMFQNYFDYNREYHSYNTRYRNDLHNASYKLDVRKFSIRAAGPVLWNALPREIRDSPTVHSFKRRLKLYLSENQRNPYWTFGDKPFLYQRTMSTRRMFSIQICN